MWKGIEVPMFETRSYLAMHSLATGWWLSSYVEMEEVREENKRHCKLKTNSLSLLYYITPEEVPTPLNLMLVGGFLKQLKVHVLFLSVSFLFLIS